ncbi:MAG: PD-(D/E)XK nuclease family protein [Ruminococcus sp.]|jgi:ATP-dependent helicase/nuclease subunit B|nr:PD-(D/E)XK nuclease family protein [Ruminococcus sp.]
MTNFIINKNSEITVLNNIKQLAKEGEKVIILVPEQAVFEREKFFCRKFGNLIYNSVDLFSFTEICGKVVKSKSEKINSAAKYVYLNKAVKNCNLRFYKKQSQKPYFVNLIYDTIKEFKQAGISSEDLCEKLSAGSSDDEKITGILADKIHDISAVYSEYEQILSEYDLSDGSLNVKSSIEKLGNYFKNKYVFVFDFISFSGEQYRLLDKIIHDCKEFNILFAADVSDSECIKRTYERITDISHFNLLKTNDIYCTENLSDKNSTDEKLKTLVECQNLYYESDYIAATIKHLIEDGYKYSDIIILSRQIEEYDGIIDKAFDRYNIPYFWSGEKNISDSSLFMLIGTILEIISKKKPNSNLIFKYAKNNLVCLPYEDVCELENYCYKWNIDGKDWDMQFSQYGEIKELILSPLTELKKSYKSDSVRDFIIKLYNFLTSDKVKIFSGISDNNLEKQGIDFNTKILSERDTKQIWNNLLEILDVLSELGEKNFIKTSEIKNAFSEISSQITLLKPPQIQNTVLISDARRNRDFAGKVLFVMGANEGLFPKFVPESGLLSDKNKLELPWGELNLSEYMTDEEFFIANNLLNSDCERLYVTYPIKDNKGAVRYRSSVLNDSDFEFLKSKNLSPEYFIFNERTLLAEYSKTKSPTLAYLLENNFKSEITSHKIEDEELIKRLFGQRLNISATGFEAYRICRFMFFCKYGLNLKALEKKKISNLVGGNFVHECLETILVNYKKDEFCKLETDVLKKQIYDFSKQFIAVNFSDNVQTKRFMHNFRYFENNVLSTVKRLQEELSQSRFTPHRFEFSFTNNIIETKDGIKLSLNGKIDRVDTYENYVRIIDYKNSEKTIKFEDLWYGLSMQMLIYLFAVTENEYSGYMPAGALYMPANEDKSHEMSGVLLDDANILNAMDIDNVFINNKNTLKFSQNEFSAVKQYVKELLYDTVSNLYSGKIEAEPLDCKYCDFADVCGNKDNCIIKDKDAKIKMMDYLKSISK